MFKECVICGRRYKAHHGSQEICSMRCQVVDNIKSIKGKSIYRCVCCDTYFHSSKDKLYCSSKCIKDIKKRKESRKPIGKANRWFILSRDNFTCVYCGRTAEDGVKLVVDHAEPVKHGGSDLYLNLVTSCYECNAGKSSRVLKKDHLRQLQNRIKNII